MCVYVLGWGLATLNETDSLIQIGLWVYSISNLCGGFPCVSFNTERDYVSVCGCVCVCS